MEERELFYTVGRNAHWYSGYGEQYGNCIFFKVKIKGVYPEKNLICKEICASNGHSNITKTCNLSVCCHPTISSSVLPFSTRLQSFSASRSFPMSQLFMSGGQSIEASPSVSVPPMNIQGLFPSGLTGLISLLSKGLSRVFSSTTVGRHQFFGAQPFLWSDSHIHLLHPYMTTGKTIALNIWAFVGKVISLLFNMLSRFVLAFLSKSKNLLISWLQSLSTLFWSPRK